MIGHLRNWELDSMFGCGFDCDLRNRIRSGEFLFTLSAQSTVLNGHQLRSNISVHRWSQWDLIIHRWRRHIKKEKETEMIYLKRVSADLDGPANTNLLLVLCVKNGLIILEKARYHQGTLINICTDKNNSISQRTMEWKLKWLLKS